MILRFDTASAESGSSNRWRFSGTKDRYTSILLKNSWLEKRTCMRVSYFEARSLKKNSSQLSHAFICENLVRKASKIVFQQYSSEAAIHILVAENSVRTTASLPIVLKNSALWQAILSSFFRFIVCAPANAGFLFVICNSCHSLRRFRSRYCACKRARRICP